MFLFPISEALAGLIFTLDESCKEKHALAVGSAAPLVKTTLEI